MIYDWVKQALLEVQEYAKLCIAVFRGMVTRPFYFRDVIEQFDAIGLGSLTVVILTGGFTGAVLALQSGFTLDTFGARTAVGRLVSASMVKELGPVLTALMVCGRVGSGIAAELGSMMVTDQINALRSPRSRHHAFNVNPRKNSSSPSGARTIAPRAPTSCVTWSPTRTSRTRASSASCSARKKPRLR